MKKRIANRRKKKKIKRKEIRRRERKKETRRENFFVGWAKAPDGCFD
jgi:hypothetical protein